MRKILAVVLLGILAWWIYRLVSPSPAEAAFEAFARKAAACRVGEALDFVADEEVARWLKAPRHRNAFCPPLFDGARGFAHEVESRTRDGERVEIEAVVRIQYDPPGVHTGMGGGMASEYRYVAELDDESGAWRVVSFTSEPLATFERHRGRWVQVAGAKPSE